MILRAKLLKIEAKKPVVVISKNDAAELDVKPLDRVEIKANRKKETAIINIAEKFVSPGTIALFSRVQEKLGVRYGQEVSVTTSEPPQSLNHIKKRLSGKRLDSGEIREIIEDVVDENLSETEIAAFVLSLYHREMDSKEAAAMSSSMTATGETLNLGRKKIFDKHSIGGIPGDKTSMLLVPVVAAAGLMIPKTSSRAITAPAGTADRMECLCPVSLELEEIRQVVNETGGCLVWGGAVDLAPADDAFIRVEYPLSIDPLLLASVLSKKKAVGANYVVIDIPTGRRVKVKTVEEAETLANSFIALGKKLGMRISAVSTYGEQPIGHGIGPALEAREVLNTVANPSRAPQDLLEKVSRLGGELFQFAGRRNPDQIAMQMLKSGKAEAKLRQIIEAQGGDPNIRAEDIPVGPYRIKVKANCPGMVQWIDNKVVIEMARATGAPIDKEAGMLFHKKLEDRVRKGDILFEIFAKKKSKLNRALGVYKKADCMGVGSKKGMVLAEIPREKENERFFILER